ncbi:TonB-dependent receptor [Hyphomicrobium sp. LHD-15]|uniref:TonB-dependent receptor plug domain-containing protein n=1 Tax=Hyphomicrobium sp. LHD-15 TaxID=3072142 RepID=UPI00281033C1|nr:TonB-dependent receptor [Hyphomicrobium sp. LHD-15]MDQ8699610.1 TonB-dependent receptor [Hyphomicrobium sp. LHD-15]
MYKCVFAAVSAAGLCVAASSALAQDASTATAGGDVTADEATPLPPVVVQAPSEPIRKRKSQAATSAGGAGTSAAASSSDTAGAAGAEGPAIGAFTLGQLDLIGGSTITNEAIWTFNTQSLDKAASLAPGVTSHSAGGRRNERDIYVRGFDRFRVPLSIDGVRIYLPADNRLDMARFLTPDLAEIQIQKGYVSVLNGPGGMGGAINLVSRKPTKELEFEARSGLVMNGDVSDLNQWSSYAYAGTRQKGYYAQISGTIVDQDSFNLSDDFKPTQPGTPGYDANFPYEQGGARDGSSFQDWKINAKLGITPNATDEYTINLTTQSGEKNAPLHIAKERLQTQRYWTWPYWDITSLSWLSKTQLGESSYFKSNVYYNTFENRLSSFDAPTGSITPYSQQTAGYTFNSDYEDYSYGGFLEFGTELIPFNTTKASIHYRSDNHAERNFARPDSAAAYVEPWQHNVEDTWSFAVENAFHATKRLDIIAGVSYDYQDVKEAEDYNSSSGQIVQNKVTTADAWNWQGGAIYSYSEDGKVHATVSSRTRFATVFERYSTRFGYATPNPDLAPERSTNYELGVSDTLFRQARVSAAIFYSDLEDAIQSAYIVNPNTNAVTSQNQNVDGEHYGAEFSVDWDIAPGIRIGGNYTYLERNYDYITPGTKPEGTPRHEGFIYLAWSATPKLTITPSLELASERNSIVTSGTTRTYIETGAYALFNIQAEYKFNENFSAAIGGTNLTDENFALAEGFPEPGRQFFANARVKF